MKKMKFLIFLSALLIIATALSGCSASSENAYGKNSSDKKY